MHDRVRELKILRKENVALVVRVEQLQELLTVARIAASSAGDDIEERRYHSALITLREVVRLIEAGASVSKGEPAWNEPSPVEIVALDGPPTPGGIPAPLVSPKETE